MKKRLCIVLLMFFVLSFMGCEKSNAFSKADKEAVQNNSQTVSIESIVNSYYEGQSFRAFGMLQKHIFENVLTSWAEYNLNDIKNPKWKFDSFAQYSVLDQNLVSISDEKLYYCTFEADDGKCGYAVVLYNENGSALSKKYIAETPYFYDLQTNIEAITTELNKTELDFASATASRARLTNTDENTSNEVIVITDEKGHTYLYYFEDSSVAVKQ